MHPPRPSGHLQARLPPTRFEIAVRNAVRATAEEVDWTTLDNAVVEAASRLRGRGLALKDSVMLLRTIADVTLAHSRRPCPQWAIDKLGRHIADGCDAAYRESGETERAVKSG